MADPNCVELQVVLDAGSLAGKAVFMHSLITGRLELMTEGDRARLRKHKTTINDVIYEMNIWDVAGVNYWAFKINHKFYHSADVFVAYFAIDDPDSLAELIVIRIPKFRYLEPGTPLLLLGTKAHLRNEDSQQSQLFPVEFGPILAQLVGAVKYVECSAEYNQGVHKIKYLKRQHLPNLQISILV